MIKHIVFWKIRESGEKSRVMEEMKNILLEISGQVPGMTYSEIGFDDTGNYDIVFYSVFDSEEALQCYQNNPLHLSSKETMKNEIVGFASADYKI